MNARHHEPFVTTDPEQWGPTTSCFVDSVATVLQLLAEKLARVPVTDCGWSETREGRPMEIREAIPFLDYLRAHSTPANFRRLTPLLSEAGIEESPTDLTALLDNLRALALHDQWHDWIGDDGTLTLLVDG